MAARGSRAVGTGRSMQRVLAAVAGAAFVASAPLHASGRHRVGPEDVLHAQEVSEPQLSPDGAWVAYVVTGNDLEADEARSAIWMASRDGTQHVQLTRPAGQTHKPRWSPDGCCLAYLAAPSGSEIEQLMLLDRRGGEPRALTHVPGGVRDFAFAPDGQRIALIMSRHGASAAHPEPLVIDAWHFKSDDEGYLHKALEHRLALLHVTSGAVEALDDAPGVAAELPVWSPDGRLIAYVRTQGIGTDRDGRTDLAVIAPDAGAKPRTLTRPHAPNNQRLAFTADSKSLLYLQGLEPRLMAYTQDKLWRVDVAGGATEPLTPKLDRAVMSYCIEKSGAALLAIESEGVAYLARLDLRSGQIASLPAAEPAVVSELHCSGGQAALLRATDSQLAEVHVLEGDRARRISGHNDALLAELQLGAVEEIGFRSRDGAAVHAQLIKPPDFTAGQRYPLLLWIHGGPNEQEEHALALDAYRFPKQLMAARGYVVLRVNYRGGSGFGLAHARAIVRDWSHLEVQDLLAGVDELIRRGIADPQRLAVGGWSYGGILTDAVIASDPRFRAAVAGAGSANQLSMYGSDQYVLQYEAEMGYPWKDPAPWLKVSWPFLHADRIRTPTLFVGGEKDFNVPIAGGEQMYQALRSLGVATELVVYPGEHHVFTRPSFVRDLMTRLTGWYERYAGS